MRTNLKEKPSYVNLDKKRINKINRKKLISWVNKFEKVPILVVGDLMLDRTLRGTVERISPEAPVPILKVHSEEKTAGGAGNVVYNLQSLGAVPILVSVRGDDVSGRDLDRDFRHRDLRTDGLIIDSHAATTTKMRIVAGQQQIVRVDHDTDKELSKQSLSQLIKAIKIHMKDAAGVIISDYGKSVVSPPVIKQVIRDARRSKKRVTVDPKIEHFFSYKGVDCITPNTKEAIEGMRSLPPKSEKDLLKLGKNIIKKLNCRSLLLTRGEKGLWIYQKNGPVQEIPALAREVFDVTGAGDTVVAVFSLARSVGAPCDEAAQIANFAAGIVVSKLGTAVTTREELIQFIENYK